MDLAKVVQSKTRQDDVHGRTRALVSEYSFGIA